MTSFTSSFAVPKIATGFQASWASSTAAPRENRHANQLQSARGADLRLETVEMNLTQHTFRTLVCLVIGTASVGALAQTSNKKPSVRPAAPAGIVIGKSTCAAAAAKLGAALQDPESSPRVTGKFPGVPGATIEVLCMEPNLPVQKLTITEPAGGPGFPRVTVRLAELRKLYGDAPIDENNFRSVANFIAPNAEVSFYKSVEATTFSLTYRTLELAEQSRAAMKRDYPNAK